MQNGKKRKWSALTNEESRKKDKSKSTETMDREEEKWNRSNRIKQTGMLQFKKHFLKLKKKKKDLKVHIYVNNSEKFPSEEGKNKVEAARMEARGYWICLAL